MGQAKRAHQCTVRDGPASLGPSYLAEIRRMKNHVSQGVEKSTVIPAQAGIQFAAPNKIIWLWIPACAGMTINWLFSRFSTPC